MTLLTPDFLDTKTYPFSALRQVMADQGGGIQEGVCGQPDFFVTQRAAGANMQVDVAAGAAWVQGDTNARQGMYHVINDATITTAALAAANATLPRLDRIILHVYDSTVTGASDTPLIEIVPGTPTAGATLDNLLGVGAVPATATTLALILVPAAATSITNANIRAKRTFARGFSFATQGSGSANYTTLSTTPVTLAAGGYDGSFEKGTNSFWEIAFDWHSLNVGGSIAEVSLLIDGVAARANRIQGSAGQINPGRMYWRSGGLNAIPAGSDAFGRHTWALQFLTSNAANAATVVNNDARLAPLVSVREFVVPALQYNGFTP